MITYKDCKHYKVLMANPEHKSSYSMLGDIGAAIKRESPVRQIRREWNVTCAGYLHNRFTLIIDLDEHFKFVICGFPPTRFFTSKIFLYFNHSSDWVVTHAIRIDAEYRIAVKPLLCVKMCDDMFPLLRDALKSISISYQVPKLPKEEK